MTTTLEEVKNRVKNRLDSIPTDLGDTMIKEMIEDACIDIEQYVGEDIDVHSIPDKFRPVVTNLSALYVLSYSFSDNLQANLTIGDGVSIDYGSRGIQGFNEIVINRIEFFKSRVNFALQSLGRKKSYGISNPR